ncbi:PREDICTED: leucine-rich repeat-containing protein 46 [Gekko japonicus]|uniref:Leucine-rich repeat-containing protein 46 n=1 Tax=Gekko japonicus TaxID=146911 RepID=A0ABM1K2I1_GEKJA|nr:PREDICTED: leucine-rich repeat-containing protein 46 [Gekko japonicus]
MPGENIHSSSKEGVNLTKSLIARRNLFAPVEKGSLESISQALTSLPVLRLDRERISHIPDLQGLEHIHSIYLQQNQIKKIENLSCLPNLKSDKLNELPQSIRILDLTGNKCTNQKGYSSCVLLLPRESILAALPHLVELDAQRVPDRKAPPAQGREEAEGNSEDSDEDIPELSQPLSTEKDFFVDLHNEFISRSERRRREALSEHEARLEELKERENLRYLLLNATPQAPSPPGPQTPTLEAPTFQTECHGSPSPSLEAASSTFHEGLSTPKGKAKVRSQIQGKTLKGEISGTAKCVRKAKK